MNNKLKGVLKDYYRINNKVINTPTFLRDSSYYRESALNRRRFARIIGKGYFILDTVGEITPRYPIARWQGGKLSWIIVPGSCIDEED
jgi:hypothetical protein